MLLRQVRLLVRHRGKQWTRLVVAPGGLGRAEEAGSREAAASLAVTAADEQIVQMERVEQTSRRVARVERWARSQRRGRAALRRRIVTGLLEGDELLLELELLVLQV